MTPCLSCFPDLCLEAIFKYLPLMDLLDTVGLVCQSWYKSRVTALRQRRRLVIVPENELDRLYSNFIYSPHETSLIGHVRRDDGSSWCTLKLPDHIRFDALLLPNDLLPQVPFTASMLDLSHITQLAWFQRCPYSALPLVIRAIEHLSEHLVELKIELRLFSDDGNNENCLNVANLLACLCRLPALSHLRLNLIAVNYTRTRITSPEIHSQLLELFRLKHFAYNNVFGYNISNIFSSLSNDAAVGTIEMFHFKPLEKMLQLSTKLTTKFRALSVSFYSRDYSPVQLFCARFSSLTKLEFITETLRLATMARCLAQLHQLVQLDLNFGLDEYVFEEEQELVQVNSVRLLTMDFITESHNDSEKFINVPEIFPNVQVLRLTHGIIECPQCGIDPIGDGGNPHVIEESEPELAHRLSECKRLTRQVFRRCPNLHTIAAESSDNHDGPLITINEL